MNETITISRTDQNPLRFTGTKIASVTDRSHTGPKQHRYSILTLYRTKKGKYVCVTEFVTHWQGEKDSNEVSVVETENEVVEYFGTDDLAQELYLAAGIDTAECVE